MPSLSAFTLPEARINGAANDIIARLRKMADANSVTIYQSVDRGVILPRDLVPTKTIAPFVRVFYQGIDTEIDSADFVPGTQNAKIELYIYSYSYGDNAEGQTSDLQQALANLCRTTIGWLQDSKDLNNPFSHSNLWGFERHQRVREEYTNVFRSFGTSERAEYPWFIAKITFEINVYNYA